MSRFPSISFTAAGLSRLSMKRWWVFRGATSNFAEVLWDAMHAQFAGNNLVHNTDRIIQAHMATSRSSFATGQHPSIAEYGNTKRFVAANSGGCTRILSTPIKQPMLMKDDWLTTFPQEALYPTGGDSKSSQPTLVFRMRSFALLKSM